MIIFWLIVLIKSTNYTNLRLCHSKKTGFCKIAKPCFLIIVNFYKQNKAMNFLSEILNCKITSYSECKNLVIMDSWLWQAIINSSKILTSIIYIINYKHLFRLTNKFNNTIIYIIQCLYLAFLRENCIWIKIFIYDNNEGELILIWNYFT